MSDEIKRNAFGVPIRIDQGIDLDRKTIAQFKLELVKETGDTVLVLTDPLDLDAVIQSYKDECGMEYAKLLMKRGLKTQDDFAAEPGDYGDTSTLPDNINDAYQESLKAQKVAKENGIPLDSLQTENAIQQYVDKAVASYLKSKQAANKEVKPDATNE